MGTIPCHYCTGEATGIDEEETPTCGDCSEVVGELPAVIEASADDGKTCSYCSDPAIGIDEDGERTCGDSETCSAVVKDPS